MVSLRQVLAPAAAASAVGHIAVVALVLVFAGVRPFDSEGANAINVDLVASNEIGQPTKTTAPPPTDANKPDLKEPYEYKERPRAQSTPERKNQPEAAVEAPSAQASRAEIRREVSSPSSPVAAVAQPSAAPTFKTPDPDLAVRYGVMLGLPEAAGTSDFDDAAFQASSLALSKVVSFRRRLRTCSVLPDSIAGSDDVRVRMRVMFTRNGNLAGEPILIEGSASAKGPALMQAAIVALKTCQPYDMLPADEYDQWKILDLEFSPRDFTRD